MTGFDIAVLVLVGLGAILGFMRGFVQECLSLLAWAAAVAAVHTLHPALSAVIEPYVHTTSGAWVLAFAILVLVPYAALRLIAHHLGRASRSSMIGPIDRMLGFGFGAVKGTLIVVLLFSVVVLGYDLAWGRGGRPTWITQSRTYPFINACSDKLLKVIAERRRDATQSAASDTSSASASPSSAASLPVSGHRRHRRPVED